MPIGTAISIGVSVAGMGIQAYGQHKAGQTAKEAGEAAGRAAESQAELDEFNAHVADLQAADTVERGDEQADEYRSQVRGAIGSTRTQQAAGNVDVGTGSTVDVQADEAYLGKLDEVTIRNNAARQAWGYTVQSLNFRQQAKIARQSGQTAIAQGESAATAGNVAAIGTIATGAGSLLSKKYGFGTTTGA